MIRRLLRMLRLGLRLSLMFGAPILVGGYFNDKLFVGSESALGRIGGIVILMFVSIGLNAIQFFAKPTLRAMLRERDEPEQKRMVNSLFSTTWVDPDSTKRSSDKPPKQHN